MTRVFRIYVCSAEQCLFKLDIEAATPDSAVAQIRAGFPDLPAGTTFYRSW